MSSVAPFAIIGRGPIVTTTLRPVSLAWYTGIVLVDRQIKTTCSDVRFCGQFGGGNLTFIQSVYPDVLPESAEHSHVYSYATLITPFYTFYLIAGS